MSTSTKNRVQAHQIKTTAVVPGWHVWNDYRNDVCVNAEKVGGGWKVERTSAGKEAVHVADGLKSVAEVRVVIAALYNEEPVSQALALYRGEQDDRKAAKKAAKDAASQGRTVQVGAIFSESWGYDQTNVDYYVVVKATEKTVWIKPCGKKHGEGWGEVSPDPSNVGEFSHQPRQGKPVTDGSIAKRVNWYGGRAVLGMTSYSNAYQVEEGSTSYQTPTGYGH